MVIWEVLKRILFLPFSQATRLLSSVKDENIQARESVLFGLMNE